MIAESSSDPTAGFILIAFAFGAYWAPTIVALAREHHQKGSIAVINAFLGWTLIGWVVALAMACSAVRPVPRQAARWEPGGDQEMWPPPRPPGRAEDPPKLTAPQDQGAGND